MNQVITPVGQQVELPGLRPQALALSPDGQILVTAGKTAEVVVISPTTGNILQRPPLPSEQATDLADPVSSHILKPDEKGQLSYTGLIFSPDGSRLYLANVNGSIKVFAVSKEHRLHPLASIPLPAANALRRKADIPSGLAISSDGKKLYVVLNLSNRLVELEAATGRLLRSWDTGVAPYTVVLGGSKAYVSNWGGRRPDRANLTGPAGRGTRVRVDPIRYIANEGSVTIIDLRVNDGHSEIQVGLHASAMALSPNGRFLVVANAASDTLSVLDTRSDKVVEAIWTRQNPGDLFGASPNALAFDRSGRTLFVCNGTQNAVAVVNFAPGKSKLQGLIPVGWFPGAIIHDAPRNRLYVANIKGIGPGEPRKSDGRPQFNSHQYYGSVSLLDRPTLDELPALTDQALANMRFPLLAQAALRPRTGQPARPVPERVGEPSLFKHVVYIIKENRTYDQVLGDVKPGNGDPELCVFGAWITPNQHKLVRDFVLLDNTYCSSILSADGHEWATTAFATDYMEKSFAGFPRSYPDGMEDDDVDALAYSPAGFIWDNAIVHGKTLRDYGEFAITRKSWVDKSKKKEPGFIDHYREFLQGTHTINLYSEPAVESLRPYLATNTVGWDLDVPDAFRAAQFVAELKQFEQTGNFPELVIMCLPNDHTSGTDPGHPTPEAQVADNDLAFGQIVDAISHSRFWNETCILAIEDDPQAGWDHVSGYRTTAYVISPYTKRGAIVGTQYNHTSLLRTLELMLGLPPMNQMDATATPMFDCFTNVADLTPFNAVTNNVLLDHMNPPAKKIADAVLRKDAYVSARLPLKKPDQCPEDALNRILWHATKGSRVPYPAWAVQAVDDD
ncbi:MAG TPA: bifunctional YncE family protein/alkaline phosphatase family protein [Verrucomicrobiae bacterium]|nr:bifunctional YncE family protein/alkaline phosphatase family protein [Verrucomicrobiae bacterium]